MILSPRCILHQVGRCLSGLVLACLPATSAAQTEPATETPTAPVSTFVETVDVDLVNVEVWVSGKAGEPVPGLGRESFTILQDGKPVPIDHFSEVRSHTPSAQGVAEEPQGVVASHQPHLVIVFDLLRLTPDSQKRMARDLRKLVTSGSVPAERILILRMDAGLFVEAPFGSTADDLEATLIRLEKRDVSTTDLASDLKQVVQDMQSIWSDLTAATVGTSLRTVTDQAGGGQGSTAAQTTGVAGGSVGSAALACNDFVDRVEPVVVGWAKREEMETMMSLRLLTDSSAFLAGLEGPKTLLYLSDGLVINPGASATGFVRGLCPAYRTDLEKDALPEEMRDAFATLARRINTNRITLHAIQGAGLERSIGGLTSQGSSDTRGVRGFERSYTTNTRRGLSLLAEETGGRLVTSRKGLDNELVRISEEMSSYYSLGFTPPAGDDGRNHEIELRIADESLQARYRRSYSDKTPDEWLTERLESALYLGMVANPLAVRLAAGEVTPSTDDLHTLPLHIMVPADRLAFTPTAGRPMSQLKIKIMSVNAETRMLVITDRTMLLPQPAGDSGEMLDLRLDIQLGSGTQMVAVGVRDQASGEASFISTTMQIGAGDSES